MKVDLITQQDMDTLHEKVDRLINLLEKQPIPQPSEWIKSFEVKKLLRCSDSTLSNYRKTGLLKFSKVGGVHYYRNDDVQKLIESHD
ncbi:MAG: helix-turn-helix domain-containing protein [Chitinophagaceae bacterium]|nr:helix-turn-helix domain-containing protein [Chitinophagaceae bacterium]